MKYSEMYEQRFDLAKSQIKSLFLKLSGAKETPSPVTVNTEWLRNKIKETFSQSKYQVIFDLINSANTTEARNSMLESEVVKHAVTILRDPFLHEHKLYKFEEFEFQVYGDTDTSFWFHIDFKIVYVKNGAFCMTGTRVQPLNYHQILRFLNVNKEKEVLSLPIWLPKITSQTSVVEYLSNLAASKGCFKTMEREELIQYTYTEIAEGRTPEFHGKADRDFVGEVFTDIFEKTDQEGGFKEFATDFYQRTGGKASLEECDPDEFSSKIRGSAIYLKMYRDGLESVKLVFGPYSNPFSFDTEN